MYHADMLCLVPLYRKAGLSATIYSVIGVGIFNCQWSRKRHALKSLRDFLPSATAVRPHEFMENKKGLSFYSLFIPLAGRKSERVNQRRFHVSMGSNSRSLVNINDGQGE